MDWFCYAGNTTTVMSVNVFLADKSIYDVTYNGTFAKVDLNKYVMVIGDTVEKGLRLNIDGYTADMKKMRACSDMKCNETCLTFTPSNDARLDAPLLLLLISITWVYLMN